jgi:uncharacterized phage-associated protein
MIHFRNNPSKSLEVILWLANKRPGIDFHAILKLLFFADKEHLNEYGRPIVGGTYNALNYGPVSQPTYDILKRDPLAMEVLGADDGLPFKVEGGYRVFADRAADVRKLSKSDVEALELTWQKYSALDFDNLTRVSHEHPAYKNAEEIGRQRMLYEEFLEGPNASLEVVEDLKAAAKRIVV